jgi:hypothetical protein
MIERALPNCRNLTYSRAKSYAIIGLGLLSTEKSKDIILELADSLADQYDRCKDSDGHWFENRMTHCNATLPWAMLMAYKVTKENRYSQIGFESLKFLEGKTFRKGYFKPVGCQVVQFLQVSPFTQGRGLKSYYGFVIFEPEHRERGMIIIMRRFL